MPALTFAAFDPFRTVLDPTSTARAVAPRGIDSAESSLVTLSGCHRSWPLFYLEAPWFRAEDLAWIAPPLSDTRAVKPRKQL